jgi:hypothetical protein
MSVDGNGSAKRPRLHVIGVPGRLGGAATKIADLIGLLHRDFAIAVVLPDAAFRCDKKVNAVLQPLGIHGLTQRRGGADTG